MRDTLQPTACARSGSNPRVPPAVALPCCGAGAWAESLSLDRHYSAKDMASTHKPDDYNTVSPDLMVGGAEATINFLSQVFGATELRRTKKMSAEPDLKLRSRK